jgi:hypothetical protein
MKYIARKAICSIVAAAAIVVVHGVLFAQTKRIQGAAIARARTTLVSRIERGMPHQRFDVWFQRLVGRKTLVSWEVNDCGEQSGTPGARDFPMCAEAIAKTPAGFACHVRIQMGTFKRGVPRDKPVVRVIFCGDEENRNSIFLDDLKELDQRAEDLIRDAQFFDPNIGIFSLPFNEKPPAGFEEFDSMWIETHDLVMRGGRPRLRPLRKNGVIRFGQTEYKLRNIFFDGKRWTFDTERIGGVSYHFDGKFEPVKLDSHGAQESERVLHGRLQRFVDGRQTAEAELILSFYMQGE